MTRTVLLIVCALMLLAACGDGDGARADGRTSRERELQELRAAVDSLSREVHALSQGGTPAEARTVAALRALLDDLERRLSAVERASGVSRAQSLSDCGEALADHVAIVRDDYYVLGFKVC